VKAFIIGHGRSGSLWLATVLKEATDLEVRHESMGHELTQGFAGVEVNSHLWNHHIEIRKLFPEARLIHLVRDGRLVVRSIMTRRPSWTFSEACTHWVTRTTPSLHLISDDYRFRLEDLTTDFLEFRCLGFACQAKTLNFKVWERLRGEVINHKKHAFPAYPNWDRKARTIFWGICGKTMKRLGYK
jgi:hypothetical protein